MYRRAIVFLVVWLTACTVGNAQVRQVNEKGFDKAKIALFYPSLEATDASTLSKTLLSASKARFDNIDLRFSEKLDRVVCCLNPKNFLNASQVDCDQHILVWPGYQHPIKESLLLRIIKALPFDRTEFKKRNFDLDFEPRGSNSFIPFHTLISNDDTLRKCVCQLTVQLPSMATADTVAVMSMLDDSSMQRVSLVILHYENQRLKKDKDLSLALTASNVIVGADFAFFVLCEPDLKHGGARSKCLEFVENFVKSRENKRGRKTKGDGKQKDKNKASGANGT